MSELIKIAKAIVNDVFAIKENELMVITKDKSSNSEIISAILEETKKAGGLGISIEIAEPIAPCAGVNDYVPDCVGELLAKTDCWLDASKKVWIYSKPFETAFSQNEKLRYMIVGDIGNEVLSTLFMDIDFKELKVLTEDLRDRFKCAKKMKFTSEKGMNIEFENEPRHVVAADNGNASVPGFHTPPALINVVPKFGTANGKIVADAFMVSGEWRVVDRPIEISVENGEITLIEGNPIDVKEFYDWLDENGDGNSKKLAHISIGLSPNILKLQGDIFYDERLYGSMTFGFGHVSPVDAPPHGLESSTHFDNVCVNATVIVDDEEIMSEGRFVLDEHVKSEKILLGE